MLLLLAVATALQVGAAVLEPGAELYPVGAPEIRAPVLVTIELVIDKDGQPTSCRVISPPSIEKLNAASCALAQTHMHLASRSSGDEVRIPVSIKWRGPKSTGRVFFDGAIPVTPEKWLTSDDYPQTALREGRGGTVNFQFDVSMTGTAENCVIVQSSGYDDIDAATCRFAARRMEFLPALTSSGQPRIAHARTTVTWQKPKLEPGQTQVQISETADGLLCKVLNEGDTRELTDSACSDLADGLRRASGKIGGFVVMHFDGPIPYKPTN